ncbi:hypothetical protein KO500_15745 [Cellulophaga baltica]|uniref:DUF6268 family outer membrane beta-barrel protein n=1 Tax=Cellulophaga TaxID=104264 RepID=UPI001C07AA37|nr:MULTISPECIES: DUF6268 family outer membrane beta-barrel protein [Cellulophaga]MBU2997895.1 hypothetical protein [Cellulophaga baltica]MDO6769296.1 DUF6268 family outer membrane beta-barrel protein [Cellulophaga sp. 1_MG-2023]
MRKLLIILIFSAVGIGFAQEIGSIYVNSEFLQNTQVATIKKNNVGFVIPIKNATNKESISAIGEYQSTHIKFVDDDVPFETEQVDNYQTFSFGVLYNRILKNGWGFTFKIEPQLSSNYDEVEFQSHDIFVNGSIVVDKLNAEAQTMWTFGAEYDPQNGLHFPIPVIAYTKRLSDEWAYKIGFPESRAKYTLNDNHNIEAFTTLDGLVGNINDDVEIHSTDYVGTLNNTYFVGGIGYNLRFLKNFLLESKVGYTAVNNLKVQSYDNNEIYDLEIQNSLYINFGLKYNLKSLVKVKSPY